MRVSRQDLKEQLVKVLRNEIALVRTKWNTLSFCQESRWIRRKYLIWGYLTCCWIKRQPLTDELFSMRLGIDNKEMISCNETNRLRQCDMDCPSLTSTFSTNFTLKITLIFLYASLSRLNFEGSPIVLIQVLQYLSMIVAPST